MAEKERITDPSSGSTKLGSETNEERGSGVSTGTDTQTQMAALSAQLKKEKDEKKAKASSNLDTQSINDDEKVVKNTKGENEFLESGETDEG